MTAHRSPSLDWPASQTHLSRWGTLASGAVHLVLVIALARMALPALPTLPNEWAVPLIFAPPSTAPADPVVAIGAATLRPPPAETAAMNLRPLSGLHVSVPPAPRRNPGAATPPAAAAPLPAATPPRLAPPSAATPDAGWLAAFTGRVQAAVQRAAVYPLAARQQHRQGRVRVGFDYVDGSARAPEILVSSSEAALDRAALRAVQNAAYPEMPPAFGRSRVRLLVWVDFRLTPEI